jgi:hypothetical protein
MLPAYRKEQDSTALVGFGSNSGCQRSAGTKAWLKRQLERMAEEEGTSLQQLEPRYAAPPQCPKQRAELNMRVEARKDKVKRWLHAQRERDEADAGDDASDDMSDDMSVCSSSELHDQIEKACPWDRPPEAMPSPGWSPEPRCTKRPEPVLEFAPGPAEFSSQRAAPVLCTTPPPSLRVTYG